MSILENLSDLAHELRCAAGTVLTILGSRLEARERARVECGPQWLTEFEAERDAWEPFECAVYPECDGQCCHHQDSAAVSAAADPSPNNPRMGDRPGSDSVILPTVEPGPQTSPPPSYQEAVSEEHLRNHVWLWEYDASGRSCKLCGYVERSFPVPLVVAGESPREEDEQPSLGEPAEAEDADELAYPFCCYEPAEVTHEDLAAHLIGAAIRANTGHVDVLVEAFASSLLTDFNITKK